VADLQKMLDKANESTKCMESKLHTAKKSTKSMESKLHAAEESTKCMESKLHAAEEANEELESRLYNAETNLDHTRKLEEDNATWEKMYEDLKLEKEKLEMEQFRPLRQENEILRKSSAESAAEFVKTKKSLEKKVRLLNAEFEQFKSTHTADFEQFKNAHFAKFEQFKKDSLATIAMKDNMVANLNMNLSGSMQESGRMREEIESFKKLTASLETKNKMMGRDLIDYDRDRRTLHELHEKKQAEMEQKLGETCRQKSEMEGRLSALYADALFFCDNSKSSITTSGGGGTSSSSSSSSGGEVLLKSGAMASFRGIAKYWRDHADGFDGSVTFPVRYSESSSSSPTTTSGGATTTGGAGSISSSMLTRRSLSSTIVHERAVLNFVKTVALLNKKNDKAQSSSLTTENNNYPIYFRFSALPQNDEGGGGGEKQRNGSQKKKSSADHHHDDASSSQLLTWKVYEPYDQLTLIAKTIFMYRSKEDSSCFRTELAEEGHFVTAVCTTKTVAVESGKTKAVRQARFSLTVISKNGRSKMHNIQFIDSNNSSSSNPAAADAGGRGEEESFFNTTTTTTGASSSSSFFIVENNNDDDTTTTAADASSSTLSQK